MLKKFLALALVLVMALFAVSCSMQDPDAPEDMQSATLAGEPFRLYVPNSWSPNTVGGISSAYYYSADSTVMVTARYYTPDDSDMTIDTYLDQCVTAYTETLTDFALTDRTADILGGKNAVKLSYTMKQDGNELTCFQITTKHGGDFVSLYGYCSTEMYEARTEELDRIIQEFVLCDKADPQGEEFVDNDTPEGMEIASADHLQYRFYVPKSWICNAESGVSEAYYPESGKSNVTVTLYSPTVSISLKDYFLQCEEEYKSALPEYERLSESERTVSGRVAYSYTYHTTVDGVTFRIMQTIFTHDELIYSITYTALNENFDLHMTDVEAMLDAFHLRYFQ